MSQIDIVEEVSSTPRWAPESHYMREHRKWDLPKSRGGMRPDRHEDFPKMVYRARRPESGGPILCVDPHNELFSTRNQLTVNSPDELEKALGDGWRPSPDEAIKHANALETAISDAAAHRHFEDRRLSAAARAEADEADASTSEHLPEIPEKPLARKGRSKP